MFKLKTISLSLSCKVIIDKDLTFIRMNFAVFLLFIIHEKNTKKRKIQSFEGSFELQEGVISMTLKSMKKSLVLFVHYTRNNMPQSLKNVINTPEELYHIL